MKTAGHLLMRMAVGRSLRLTLLRATFLGLLLLFIFQTILLPVRVVGISMAPNYRDGEIHVVNRLAYRWSRPRRGDVVCCRFLSDSVFLIKRIVALPGERIAIRRGVIFIDGEPLEESYLRFHPLPWNLTEMQLGPDSYFVVGDNRTMDLEDHDHGPKKASLLVGKILF